jgi:CDP-glucose 4,6-dehydratase
MESLVMPPSAAFWRTKRVFLTGHTGFKGSWLTVCLSELGAEVHGLSLAPPTSPAMFDSCALSSLLASDTRADIRDAVAVQQAMQAAQPDIVLHLAAQPLVKVSYVSAADTYETNVMGTLRVLDAVRQSSSVKSVVVVTTDKCYENREWPWSYREIDALGGHDPYSSSKACAEILLSSYRRSFFAEAGVAVATARAGNVIGGGDWAQDRLVPDFLRAMDAGEALSVRASGAIRPWQHVLEPLHGYLLLAERLYQEGQAFADAWNFGPVEEDCRSVGWIADTLCELDSRASWQRDQVPHPHEAGLLKLDSSKALSRLGWRPRWHLHQALRQTLAWHHAWLTGSDMLAFTRQQIHAYWQH